MKVLELAQKEHWGFRVKEEHGMIEVPEYHNEWWYIPAQEDDPIIPENARTRVEAIKRMMPIQGLIIGHEAPKLLCKPKEVPKPKVQPVVNPQNPPVANPLNGSAVLGILLLIPEIMLGMLPLLLLDPALYVVLPDGTRIEVMSWYVPM